MTFKKRSPHTKDRSAERIADEEQLQKLAARIAEERFKSDQGDCEWRYVNLPVMKDGRSLFGRKIVHIEPNPDNRKVIPLDKELDIWIIAETGHIVGRARTRTTPVRPTYEVVELPQLSDEDLRRLHARAEKLFDGSSGGWRIIRRI